MSWPKAELSAVLRPLSISPTMEGVAQDSGCSISSRSDSSEHESMSKSHSSLRNFPSHRYFISKPIYPLSFPPETSTREAGDATVTRFSEFDAGAPLRDARRFGSAGGSVDFTDVSEPFESDLLGRSCNPSKGLKCELCERFLSHMSPWSSRRIVRSEDMPIAGVLSCRHVFHAECLEQTTLKTHKIDPPCPLCVRSEEKSPEQQPVFSKMRNSFPRLGPFREDGPLKPWGCAQAGDCVEGALHVPPRNAMLLNRHCIKKNISLKGNSGKEFPGKLRKSSPYSSQLLVGRSVDRGPVGSSKTTTGPSMK